MNLKAKATSELVEEVIEDVVPEEGNISTKKMEDIIELLSKKFNLNGNNYVVVAFNDKGSSAKISFTNEGFEITITIKDLRDWGIE